MSTNYEILTSVTDINDEVWFEIQNRTITPLNKESIIDVLVQRDNNSRNFGFVIQRFFENEDLSTKRIRIHYINSLNQHDMVSAHSIKVIGDEQEAVAFKWKIGKKVCLESGNMKFAIEFYNDDESYQLFTKTTMVTVVAGLDDFIQIEEPDSDWLNEYSMRMNKLESYVKEFKEAADNGEFDGGYTLDTFAGAIKEVKSGTTVACDDISPLAHTVNVKVVGVSNPTSIKVIRYGASVSDNYKTYTPNADGTVSGITSLYPKMTITTDTVGVTVECEYNKNTIVVVDKMQTNIDNNARSKACAVICETDGTTVALNDSSNDKFQELKICGKSTQNGTPTPDAPIDIVSIGVKNGMSVDILGKNFIDLENGYIVGRQHPVNFIENGFVLDASTSATRLYRFPCQLKKGLTYCVTLDVTIVYGSGEVSVWLPKLEQYIFLNKPFVPQDDTDEIGLYVGESFVPTVLNIKNVQVALSTANKTYEPYKHQLITALITNGGLKGIPVTDPTLATYTDENGQMWCSDEIDLVRGVYIKRIDSVVLDGSSDEKWTANTTNTDKYRMWSVILVNKALGAETKEKAVLMCDCYPTQTANTTYLNNEGISINKDGTIYIYDTIYNTNDVALWQAHLAQRPMNVLYGLKTPIETPLTKEQIELCKSLHTNYPNTTITNSENAHMLVKYNADTKLYIDNAIANALKATVS